MVRNLLVRGMLAGFLAGILVFGFARIYGEPQVDRAIAFEAAMDASRMAADAARGIHEQAPPELVSRPMQASFGLLTGVMVYSTAFGGLFALVFAFAHARVGAMGARATASLLALTGFIAVYVVPNLKYPANPPSVGQPDTIGMRTEIYFVMMALSIAAMVGAAMLRRRLAPRHDAWSAALIAAGFYVVVVAVVAAVLPVVDEVPANFPAVVLWKFRIDALAMQAIMWTTIGLGFGALVDAGERERRRNADPWMRVARR